jgi:hypothetical protein
LTLGRSSRNKHTTGCASHDIPAASNDAPSGHAVVKGDGVGSGRESLYGTGGPPFGGSSQARFLPSTLTILLPPQPSLSSPYACPRGSVISSPWRGVGEIVLPPVSTEA